MLLAAALATATPAVEALPFAPPLDRPLHYRIVESRPGRDGRAMRFTTTEEVVFAPEGEDYLMIVRALDAHAEAPPRVAALFEGSSGAFVGVPIRLRVSRQGEPLGIEQAQASWARAIAALRTLAARAPAARRAMLTRVADGYAAMPASARDALISASARTILAADIPPLPTGSVEALQRTLNGPGGAALRATGHIRREPDGADARRYRIDLATPSVPPGLVLDETDEIALSARTGLLNASTRTLTVGTAGAEARPLSTETITLAAP